MSESKKGVHQIGPNSFLFFNTPEIFYNLSLEEIDSSKIRIILIKILSNSTDIFDTIIPFKDLGTEDNNPQDTIKTVDFIIFNYNFIIKEEKDKVKILINTKNPKKLELNIHKLELDEDIDKEDINKDEQINFMENKLKELNNVSENQEKEIYNLRQNEKNNLNKIKNLGQLTYDLLTEIESKTSEISNNNNIQNNYGNQNNKNNFDNQNYNNNYQRTNTAQINNPYIVNNNNNDNPYVINNNQYKNNDNPYQTNNFYKINNNPYQNSYNNNNPNIANNPYQINNNNYQNNNFKLNKARTVFENYNNNNFDSFNRNNNQGQNPYL